MATTETIDHTTLARLVEVGAVRSADVIGHADGWGVVIKYGMTERALAARRGNVRTFRKFETLVAYLKELGIAQYSVNAADFEPVTLKKTHARPDAAARLRGAFEAAEHDKWFRAQVEQGLNEADDPAAEWVSQEEAAASWQRKRAELLKRAQGGDA